MIHVWSCLSIEASQRHYRGNAGYQDVLGKRYVWDSTVANYGRVAEGDVIIVRDRQIALGCGWIDNITTAHSFKERHRCPVCGSTDFKQRTTRTPEYRCTPCGREFDEPRPEGIEVTVYAADYARTWQPFSKHVPISELDPLFLNRSKQQSIRELSPYGTQEMLGRWAGMDMNWSQQDVVVTLAGGHGLAVRKVRKSQAEFRDQLLQRFGSHCAVSGPQPRQVLEAAHLYQYARNPHHDIHGGLLLRRDLHALFDAQLLTVCTSTWTVELAPRIRDYQDYSGFHREPLQIPAALRPDAHHLDTHRSQAQYFWV